MITPRAMPCLLLKGNRLVKSTRFKRFQYIGDPLNAIHIFNEMEVDELVLMDISATKKKIKPNFKVIEDFSSECFMPFAYGGGIRDLEDAGRILKIGAEKIIINTYAYENPQFVRKAAEEFGSQSVIVSIDVKKNWFGSMEVFTCCGTLNTHKNPAEYAKKMEDLGAGEIFLNSIDRDGTWMGYDIDLLKEVTGRVGIPVVACGGAGKYTDLSEAIDLGGASAVAAGSLFVFQGPGKGVLINFPQPAQLKQIFRLGVS